MLAILKHSHKRAHLELSSNVDKASGKWEPTAAQ